MAEPLKTTKDRVVPLDRIRNIGIIAHIDAGKTTTTERILFYSGKTYKVGDIDEGTTVTDWMDQEKERGITIVSAAITTFWRETRINLIDTPGHVDFTAEVERSLRVLDGAVMIFDAKEGVQAQSETVWHQADKYGVPRLVFINKMDNLGADFDNVVKMIKKRFEKKLAVLTIPIGKEHDFRGVISLLDEKMLVWDKDKMGMEFSVSDIAPEFKRAAADYRSQLVEEIAAQDESLLEKFLNDQPISEKELKQSLRKSVIAGDLVPIYCGSSLRNKGIQPLLDGVVDYLPSPIDLPSVKGINPKTGEEEERKPENDQPLSALIFKVQADPHVGRLSYLRVYSGILRAGSSVLNANRGKTEKIGRLLLMHADKREGIEEGYAGEIVAAIGLKNSGTGDTLSDPKRPISFESIQFADPVISLAIEPESKVDQEKLGQAINKLLEEDPTLKVKTDHETGQTIISGMGELHLEIIVERMRREFGVKVKSGQPQVAYRETITVESKAEGKYIRQSGGRGQYGHCLVRAEPLEAGRGLEFASEIKGAAIPSVYIPAIEKGVREAAEKGVLAGYPVVDLKVVVYDGSYHDVDSSDMAFKIAGSIAFQEAVKRAAPVVLEPIMKMEVTAPDEFMGQVIGDLSSRRTQILGTENRGQMRIISALTPLANIRGYATIIRSLTKGRGSFYAEPAHYARLPGNIQDEIINKDSGEAAENKQDKS